MPDVRQQDETSHALESRFRTAFAEAPIGMVLATPEGRILEVNQAYLNMLGYSAEELALRDSSHFTHPDDVAATREFFTSLRDGLRPTGTFEKRYIRKNGQLLWVRASATMRRDERGKPSEVVGIIEDITERKALELRVTFLMRLDDATRPLTDPLAIPQVAARLLSEHLDVSRCAYAEVGEDEDSVNVIGDFNRGVESIVGRHSFSSFGAEFLRMMRAGETFVVSDSESDHRIHDAVESYRTTAIRSRYGGRMWSEGRPGDGATFHFSIPRGEAR